MKVAYLINQYPKVSHTFIRREILALERQGVAVVRFAMRGWDAEALDPADQAEAALTRYILRDGAVPLALAVLRLGLQSPKRWFQVLKQAWAAGRPSGRARWLPLIYFAEACWLVARMREAKVTHLHAHFGTNPAEVARLAHLLGGPPYSFTVHGPEEFDKPEQLQLAAKADAAAAVVAISSFGRSQLWRWLPAAQWGKVAVVHCGLDPAFTSVPRVAVPDVPRLVCVGRLCEQKGQLLLVEALGQLRDRGVHCELVLAGDGEMRDIVEAAIARRGLAGQVRITGWIGSDQVRDELLAARGMVLPSFAEGLPVVIMEAMALYRPVVTTLIAGIPELVRAGVDGWLCPAGDVEALADAMAACLQTPVAELDTMGQAAHDRVTRRHDIEASARRLRQQVFVSGGAGAGAVLDERNPP